MEKLTPYLQLFVSAFLVVIVGVTLINLVFIILRPETISVVNVMIGQIFIMACLAALAKVLFTKGREGLKNLKASEKAS